jgi:hypothetical protein
MRGFESCFNQSLGFKLLASEASSFRIACRGQLLRDALLNDVKYGDLPHHDAWLNREGEYDAQ